MRKHQLILLGVAMLIGGLCNTLHAVRLSFNVCTKQIQYDIAEGKNSLFIKFLNNKNSLKISLNDFDTIKEDIGKAVLVPKCTIPSIRSWPPIKEYDEAIKEFSTILDRFFIVNKCLEEYCSYLENSHSWNNIELYKKILTAAVITETYQQQCLMVHDKLQDRCQSIKIFLTGLKKSPTRLAAKLLKKEDNSIDNKIARKLRSYTHTNLGCSFNLKTSS